MSLLAVSLALMAMLVPSSALPAVPAVAGQPSATVVDVRFEHHIPGQALGIDDTAPRLSWRFANATPGFRQDEYEIQLSTVTPFQTTELGSARVSSSESQLVPWPLESPSAAASRQRLQARVRARAQGSADWTAWSEPSWFETGLLSRADWAAEASFVSAPWGALDPNVPQPEDLFRKDFELDGGAIRSARLHITAQGVYEAEINAQRVGDFVLAPGWTSYNGSLAYQTYDVTEHLQSGANCIGVRVAEGWFKGRLGFAGGWRNLWGDRTALLAQLDITMDDGSTVTVATDATWQVTRGPIRLAEIYDGEKYDATAEIPGWSSVDGKDAFGQAAGTANVEVQPALPATINLRRGSSEPVRRIETIKPIAKIITPSNKTILDFGQNLVGFLRLNQVKGPKNHSILLSHAEVLEKGELGTRPLRLAKAQDRYTLRGDEAGETYEPRFTFHGFRYAQVDGWPAESGDLESSVEAILVHSDMEEKGSFSCSDSRLNKLFENIRWSMRDNFLSVPTDCPQRDERMGWTGDLAVFAPTANFLYGAVGVLRDWLENLRFDQKELKGVPPMVSPNMLQKDPTWGLAFPCAIWHDSVVLVPWAVWEATGDLRVLEEAYDSMKAWLGVIPRDGNWTHLWKEGTFQLGDWLDPAAPADNPTLAQTNSTLVANTFLINSLDHVARTAALLGLDAEADSFRAEAKAARAQFAEQYLTADGRLTSDSQAAYALAVAFDLLPSAERKDGAATRLAEIVRANDYRVGTGFAGTPFVTEALVVSNGSQHADVALAMLTTQELPSWLYPVSMGATTVWERWDSMLPDGSINPGDMTSFNHYAYGAVAVFMVERLVGLKRLEPGWRRARVEPYLVMAAPGAISWANAEHLTPYGKVSCAWRLEAGATAADPQVLVVDVVVPPMTEMEVVLPGAEDVEVVGSGEWSFRRPFTPQYKWPIASIASQ